MKNEIVLTVEQTSTGHQKIHSEITFKTTLPYFKYNHDDYIELLNNYSKEKLTSQRFNNKKRNRPKTLSTTDFV